jgi:hypothetical protein
MGIKTTVGRVATMGGGRYDQPGGILVDERVARFARGRSRGNFYVVAEVSGPSLGRDVITRLLAETMRDAYYSQRGSVTAGLQQAIREANNLLFEENRTSLPGERRTAAVSCAVLRDDDLFIAQAGPTALYLARGDMVTRFPDVSPWLDGIPPEQMDAAALGERRDLNIGLFHSPVQEGDTVLLANEALARLFSPGGEPQILALEPVEAVLEDLLAAGRGSDISALVIRLGDEARQATPVTSAGPVPAAPAEPAWQQISARLADLQPGEYLASAGRATGGLLGGAWAGMQSLLKRMVPERGLTRGGAKPPVAGTKPKARARRKRPAATQSDRVQKILLGLAVAIPLIVGAIVLVVLLQRGQAQRAELEALWQQANAEWQQAQSTTETATIRTHLASADKLLQELLQRQPDHAEATDLRQRIQVRLDVINSVKRISWIGELNAYADDALLSRVIVQGTHVFVMDRNNGRVYHHQLDDQLQNTLQPDTLGTVLLNKGDQIGGVLVGDLVDMVWMPIGPNRQKASLVILESSGTLLDYDPTTGELLPLRLGATEQWQFPELVGSHSGRFYLLDSSANQIWRYSPTADGYSEPPDDWLQESIDLAGVVDMAVGDSIYLLYANGQLRKLTIGRADDFDISDWDMPPRSPAALFTRPPDEAQWIYVADRGNGRIVQCGKEGLFKQQFRLAEAQVAENGDPLTEVSSLFVDEIVGHAFVLSGQKLYLLILPMSN